MYNQCVNFLKQGGRLIIIYLLRPFLKIKPGRVVFFSYYGKQYSCNPKYISEYIVQNYSKKFEVIWLFKEGCMPNTHIDGVCSLLFHTFKSIIAINTAEFVITNCRTLPRVYDWIKTKQQKYIMTWHGSFPVKKVERDAQDKLSHKYVEAAKVDSTISSLFLSESRFTTELFRKSFWYDGEVMERGVPRSDIFYATDKHEAIKKRVLDYYGFSDDIHVVLYAPTFRSDFSLDKYDIDWSIIIPSLKKILGGEVKVLVRLHPNFISTNINTTNVTTGENIYDATKYDEINDLLIASDVLFSDYSSCMFDFAYLKRPCFIYANILINMIGDFILAQKIWHSHMRRITWN